MINKRSLPYLLCIISSPLFSMHVKTYQRPAVHRRNYSQQTSYWSGRGKLLEYSFERQIPHAVLRRYIKDSKSTLEHAEKIRKEWIRYAIIASTSGKSVNMFSKDVDKMWHTFLLFNRDYEHFCSFLPINDHKKMLYHIPFEPGQGCPKKCNVQEKMQFITTYQEYFDTTPDVEIWDGLKICSSNCIEMSLAAQRAEDINKSSQDHSPADMALLATTWLTSFVPDKSNSSCGSSAFGSTDSGDSSSCGSGDGSGCSSGDGGGGCGGCGS